MSLLFHGRSARGPATQMVDAIRDHYTAVGTNVIRASDSKEAQQWRKDEAALLIDGVLHLTKQWVNSLSKPPAVPQGSTP